MRWWVLFFPTILFGLTIYSPKAAPALPLLKLTNQINVVFYQDLTTEILPKIVQREEALFILPVNMAAKLYQKTPDLRLIGITSVGMLALLTTNISYSNWQDLAGKKVHIGAPGSSPDTISRVLLRVHGVKPEIIYGDSPQIAQLLIAGKIENAVLPEPLASLALAKNPHVRMFKIYREEWNRVFSTKSGVPQTALVSFAGYLSKNQQMISSFLQAYHKEVQWVNAHPAEASQLGVVGLGLQVPPEVIEKSIPRMGLTYLPARFIREDILLYLKVLKETDEQTVGSIPDDTFFAW
ncbi:MAG: ABC transporter substrate-binding protein [Brevinematales bacterium]|nr:ABC transporter substrate-binding protein [Brevinematales bacterium]